MAESRKDKEFHCARKRPTCKCTKPDGRNLTDVSVSLHAWRTGTYTGTPRTTTTTGPPGDAHYLGRFNTHLTHNGRLILFIPLPYMRASARVASSKRVVLGARVPRFVAVKDFTGGGLIVRVYLGTCLLFQVRDLAPRTDAPDGVILAGAARFLPVDTLFPKRLPAGVEKSRVCSRKHRINPLAMLLRMQGVRCNSRMCKDLGYNHAESYSTLGRAKNSPIMCFHISG